MNATPTTEIHDTFQGGYAMGYAAARNVGRTASRLARWEHLRDNHHAIWAGGATERWCHGYDEGFDDALLDAREELV